MLCTSAAHQQKELRQKKCSLRRSRSFSPFIRLREWKTNYNNSWRSNFSFYVETDARRRNPLFCQMILSFIDDAKSRRKSWILKQLCVFIFTSQRRAEHTHTLTARIIMCPAYTHIRLVSAAQPFSRPRHGRDKMRDARERVCIYMAKETRKQDMALNLFYVFFYPFPRHTRDETHVFVTWSSLLRYIAAGIAKFLIFYCNVY
jgi:hypothetical protein